MKQTALIDSLWNIAKPTQERCMGCGHENSCAMRGCAIIRAAILELENLSIEVKVLKEEKKNGNKEQHPEYPIYR